MAQAGYLAGEDYRRETERLIKEHAGGGAVILGRAGAVILRDHPGAAARPPRRPAGAPRRAGDGAREPQPRRTPSGCARSGDRAREAYVRHFYGCDAKDSVALSPRDRLDGALARGRGRDHRRRGALRFVGALEGLRGYAALLMVVYHAWVLTGGPLLGGGRAVLSGGFLAVDLFFVLSAFVLTLPAARTGDFGSWRDYALRRAARIVPAYYAALAVALVLFHPLAGPAADRRPPTVDALLAAPELPAGRGAAAPRLRRRARLPRRPAAVDAVGRGRVLRRRSRSSSWASCAGRCCGCAWRSPGPSRCARWRSGWRTARRRTACSRSRRCTPPTSRPGWRAPGSTRAG